MKTHKTTAQRLRGLAVLVSDAFYYWRNGCRLSVAWHRAKRTFK